MATNLTPYFRGKVVQEHYSQPIGKDGLSAAGAASYIGVFEAQTFTFEGLTSSLAHADDEVTCTDVDGKTYTFYLRESYTDSSTGYGFFAKEECKVTRQRTSPHLWSVTFRRVGGKLLRNGVVFYQGPSWMDHPN